MAEWDEGSAARGISSLRRAVKNPRDPAGATLEDLRFARVLQRVSDKPARVGDMVSHLVAALVHGSELRTDPRPSSAAHATR